MVTNKLDPDTLVVKDTHQLGILGRFFNVIKFMAGYILLGKGRLK